jgi:hypothetical protein
MSKSKLAVIAYAVSLTAVAAGTVTLFQTVVGLGPADRNALAAGQAPAVAAKNAVSSASKVAESSKPEVEATTPKRVTQSRPRQRIAQDRHDYSSYERRYYGGW